jgi:hypothetical protein
MISPQLIQNPLIPTSIDGAVNTGKKTDLFQIDLRSFATSAARLSLTNLSGDANLKITSSNGTTVNKSSTNSGRLSESILLGEVNPNGIATNLLAPDLYTIEVSLADGAVSANYKLNVAVNANANLSNIWWRNSGAAQAALWRMDGAAIKGSEFYEQIPADWQVQGVADLNGDGEDDLLWRDGSGNVAYWLFKDGKRVEASLSFGGPIPLDWKIVAVKDLDGDNNADLVWQNASQGIVALWTLKTGKFVSGGVINTGREWQPIAPAYLDADTKADFVFRNSQSGEIALWKVNGTQVEASKIVKTGASWIPQFFGNINDDIQEDIVLRDTSSGAIAIWQMDGVNIIKSWATGAISQDWQIETLGNFDGTANGGNKDLLWRNRRTGEMAIWLFSADGLGFADRKGLTFTGGVYNKGVDWTISDVGDFNNDGKEDILYRNEKLGIVEVLEMNGATINKITPLNGIDAGWKVGGILAREVTSEPFDISGRSSTGGFSSALAFDMGAIQGTSVYSDTVRSSFDDYFKFTASVISNIRLDLANNPNVQFQLFRVQEDGSLGSALTYSRDMEIEIGNYAVRVFTTQANTTAYTMNVFGQPRSTDIEGISFSIASNNGRYTLTPSANNGINQIATSFQVKNNSSTALKDIEVGFRVSRDQRIDLGAGTTDTWLEFFAPGSNVRTTTFKISTPMDPGEVRSFDLDMFLPTTDSSFWFVDGKYTVGMVLDPNDNYTELSETNNLNGAFGKDRVELTIAGTETVEVIGTNMEMTSPIPDPSTGGQITVNFTVASIGNKSLSAGSNFPIEFWLSADPVITEEDLFLGSFVIENSNPSLAPLSGAGDTNPNDGVSPTRTFTIQLTMPKDWNMNLSDPSGTTFYPAGTTFYISSWIDPNGLKIQGEVDRINNRLDPATLETPETTDDTLGKNYVTFVR